MHVVRRPGGGAGAIGAGEGRHGSRRRGVGGGGELRSRLLRRVLRAELRRPGEARLIERFVGARRDPGLAVLEGLHALKHALRFGADVLEAATPDAGALATLAGRLAPDLEADLRQRVAAVPQTTFARLVPRPPRTGVVAIARRRAAHAEQVLKDPTPRPLVLLVRPRHHGNIGAVVRVAAAARAAGVLTTGEHDPWHPAALRAAAGLHYALPVTRLDDEELLPGGRPLLALDPEGAPLRAGDLPARALLAFGSEREGLPDRLLDRAHGRLALPMRPGVSSLNLATAVAATLYLGTAPDAA